MSVNCADLSVTSMCYDKINVNNLEYATSCTQWTPLGAAAVRENSLFYEICFPANCAGTYWANEFCQWFLDNLGYGTSCSVSMVECNGLYDWDVIYNTNHGDICIYTPVNTILWNTNHEDICFIQDVLMIKGQNSCKSANTVTINTSTSFSRVLKLLIPKGD